MSSAVSQLGYLVFGVKDLAAWEQFAVEVLGLMPAPPPSEGALAFRLDAYTHRLVVEAGEADDLVAVGWQVENETALNEIVARLRASGVAVEEGSGAEAARRRVARLVKLRDPAGTPTEIFFGPERAAEPFRSRLVRAGFVADERGLGHVVLAAPDKAASQKFYCELLGFKLSDRIVAEIFGYHADIVFLHANARHHSLALGDGMGKRIHHFLVEARTMDEVGHAFDRALKKRVPIMLTLGRHPNDRMFSFYAFTPSGFQFEFGWGGRDVDDATWEPVEYDQISEWGHHPPARFAPRK